MNRLSRWRTFALVTASALSVSAPVAPQSTPAPSPFDAFAFLAGSCWRGTFPGKTTTDEHCFEWLHGGKFLRDRHTVNGGAKPYAGETTYAWDAANRRIVYWYIASDGAFSTGTANVQKDAIVFPESHVSASGTRELLNTWRRSGPDAYHIRVTEKTKTGDRELWSMEMRRIR